MSMCFLYNSKQNDSNFRLLNSCEYLNFDFDQKKVTLQTTLILQCQSREPAYLRAWYRGPIQDYSIVSADIWDQKTDPFVNLIYRQDPNTSGDQNSLLIQEVGVAKRKTLKRNSDVLRAKVLKDIGISNPLQAKQKSICINEPSPHYCPYSVLEVGPFGEETSVYAVRYSAEVSQQAVSRAVTEDFINGLRFHEVYNSRDTLDLIRYVDLPRLRSNLKYSTAVYKKYRDFFEVGSIPKQLVPERYALMTLEPNAQKDTSRKHAELLVSEGAILKNTEEVSAQLSRLRKSLNSDINFFHARRGKDGYVLKLKTQIPIEERIRAWKSKRMRYR